MKKRQKDALATLSRRELFRGVGAGLVVLPLMACDDNDSPGRDDGDDVLGDAPPGDTRLDVANDTPNDIARDSVQDPVEDSGAIRWATGGTAAMTGIAGYRNPFESPVAACPLIGPSTLGPCYDESPIREDISEGYPGIPVRLGLRVLGPDCRPIENARVEIWHTRNSGIYSKGPIDFCTEGDADAAANGYFRGGQMTNSSGIVYFNTCYPGWYSIRTVHIHFQVFPSNGSSASLISQLFFSEALTAEIHANHIDYREFGQPAFVNSTDDIYQRIGAAGLLEFERMSDGAMLAWKDIVISA